MLRWNVIVFQTFAMSMRLCHKLNNLVRKKCDVNRALACHLCCARIKV